MDRLRAIDADVLFRATSIEAGTVPFTKVSLHAKLHDGVLTLEPVRFDLGSFTVIVPNGNIRSAFAELTGIDVAAGVGLLLKKPDDRAPIRCGVAQFNRKDGTAHAQNIVFDTQNVPITGGAQIYLGPERLDLTIQGQPKKIRLARLRAPVEVKGKVLKPSFRLETGHLLKQGGIAAALGTLLTPFAAILAFVDPGLAKDQNCRQRT